MISLGPDSCSFLWEVYPSSKQQDLSEIWMCRTELEVVGRLIYLAVVQRFQVLASTSVGKYDGTIKGVHS